MFKRISVLFVAVMAVLVMAGGAKAAPTYYTFEGTTYEGYDPAGAVAAAGLSTVGSAVSYTFMVDTARAGTYTLYNGSTYTITNTASTDYFYADMVSTAPILDQNGGYAPYQTGTDVKKYNYGYSQHFNNDTALYGGSYTNYTSVDNNGSYNYTTRSYLAMADWTVGSTGFIGFTKAYNDLGASSSTLYSHLTITGISATNPLTAAAAVPEPSTLLLLGSGLAGLGFIRRKFRV